MWKGIIGAAGAILFIVAIFGGMMWDFHHDGYRKADSGEAIRSLVLGDDSVPEIQVISEGCTTILRYVCSVVPDSSYETSLTQQRENFGVSPREDTTQ